MSCAFIDDGRPLNCKNNVGGLKNVYFIKSVESEWTVGATDEISAYTGSASAYKYELKGNSTFEQTITSSRENGTVFYEQVLNLTLPQLSAVDNKAIKLLTWDNPQVLVEDYNGNIFLVGLQNGADVTGGTIVTGGAMGDMSGYTLTLSAMEKIPANFLDDTLAAVGITVVV
jgi:hypothetical protein